jgi:glycosyltransferase involved in cell wall biosynthesis
MCTIKVLHIIARMNVGGTARYVSEVVDAIPGSLLATGFVQGAEIEDSSTSAVKVIRIKHLGRKIAPLNDLRALLEIYKVVKEFQPEIIHTHTFKAGLLGRLLPGGHYKRIHTYHGHLFADQSFSPLAKEFITFAEKFLANRTSLLVTVGEKVGDELRAQEIGLDQDWLSIPPGVNPLPAYPRSQARSELGLDPDAVLVGWMARMTSVKNPELLLEVARRLPSVNFVMAGGGDLLETIKQSAPANVRVIGWSDAAYFWSAVDLAISTSDNEGMPIALIEAQLAGVPVIATDVGSNAEVIRDGVTGIVTDKAADALVAAVERLVTDATLRASMGQAGAQRARNEFSMTRMIDAHKAAYERVAAGNRHGRQN